MVENRDRSIDSKRISLAREVRLRFPAFDDFVTEFSANLSTTGMFIVSKRPRAPGTEFAFEFSVADDWKLIRGKGQVVWARYRDEGKDRPAGMGVRFTELDAQSRRLIRWVVEKHVREGGTPFELDDLRSTLDETLSEFMPAASRPGAAAGGPGGRAKAERGERSEPRPPLFGGRLPINPAAAAIGAAAIGIVLLIWLSEAGPRLLRGRSPESGAQPAAEGAGEASEAGAPSEATEVAAPSGEAPPPAAAPRPDSVADVVDSWARAWSSQNVDRYLDHYASRFQPPDGQSRDAWSRSRGQRLRRPEFIRVEIEDLTTEVLDANRALARFSQTYRSDTYGDEVTKVLELVREDGTWKIAAERVVG